MGSSLNEKEINRLNKLLRAYAFDCEKELKNIDAMSFNYDDKIINIKLIYDDDSSEGRKVNRKTMEWI